ncbi:MAG TPA: ABC transporter permease [Microbacteriaceae bacterium]|nr:ABC transporter permease [Microbacteriaceae bacterium]
MLSLIARRLITALPLLFVVTATMFLFTALIPGDPARIILGEAATPAAVEQLREQMGLDKPLLVQYVDWVIRAVQLDLGQSIYSGQPVTSILNERLPVTLSLILLSTIVITIVGMSLGMVSALRGGWVGRALDAVSLLGIALPSFWIAVILVATLAVAVPIFPATGYTAFERSPGLWLLGLVLPVIALSLVGVTVVAKQMRDSVLDVMQKDYVRVLRASGIAPHRILFKHVLRNASIPTVTMIGLGAIASLTGSVFVENVFVLPGLGFVAVSATLKKDLPLLLGLGLYFTLIVILVNLIVDIVYSILNPKVRLA